MNNSSKAELALVDMANPLANLASAWEFAVIMSQSSLVPQSLQNKPANTLLVMMMGQELNLTPAQAFRLIYSPGPGQTQLSVELMLARLRDAGHDYEYKHTVGKTETEDACTFTVIRKNGKEYTETFTTKDALTAGLVKERDGKLTARSSNGNPMPWELYRADMLFARAAARAIKHAAPEVCLGFGVQGVDSEPPPVVMLQPAAPRTAPGAGDDSGDPPKTPAAVAGEGPTPSQGHSAAPHPQQEALPEWEKALLERQAAELEELDTLNEGLADHDARALPSGAPTVTVLREEDGWATLPAITPQGEKMAGRAAQMQLVERFAALGWDIESYRIDVLRACSVFCQRRITSAADLTAKEATALAGELARIARDNEEDFQPVALAEQVQVWEEEALSER